jgi:hypothetical protein
MADRARYFAALDTIIVRLEVLRKRVVHISLGVQENQTETAKYSTERMRFIRQIEAHLRIIDHIAKAAATALHFPIDRIPTPDEMINRPHVLQSFLRQIGDFSREASPTSCSHTRAEVEAFLQKSYV